MEKDENLPVKLPEDVSFSGTGNPLETSESFKLQYAHYAEDLQREILIQWIHL